MFFKVNSLKYRWAVLAFFLGLAWPASGAQVPDEAVLSEAEFGASAGHPQVLEHARQLEGWVTAKDTAAIVSAVVAIEQDSELPGAIRARLLHASLMNLARVPATEAARDVIRGFVHRPAELFLWHREGMHRIAVPALAPSAAARFTLSSWVNAEWEERAAAGLARYDRSFLDAWIADHADSGGYTSPAGLVRAFSSVEEAALRGWPDEFARRLAQGDPVAPFARVVAVRLRSLALAESIIRDADSMNALALMQQLADVFSTEEQVRLLEHASHRNDLASSAMYQLGKTGTPGAHALLVQKLASPQHGTSAAAALARQGGAETFSRLAQVVRSDGDAIARRRAVLALHLGRDAGGLEHLNRLYAEAALPKELREHIRRRLK